MWRPLACLAPAVLLLASCGGSDGSGSALARKNEPASSSSTSGLPSTTDRATTTTTTAPQGVELHAGDAVAVSCGFDEVRVGVVKAGQMTVQWDSPVSAADLEFHPKLTGCQDLSHWNDDFTRYALTFTVPGEDGSHVGYVDMKAKKLIDLTAPRASSGFGAATAEDDGAQFLAESDNRARFPGDAIVASGSDANGQSDDHIIRTDDPTTWVPWRGDPRGPKDPTTGTDDGAYRLEAANFGNPVESDMLSPDGRYVLNSGQVFSVGECHETNCDHPLQTDACMSNGYPTQSLLALGWKDTNTVVAFDADESGDNTTAAESSSSPRPMASRARVLRCSPPTPSR
jgi:hypothetical protein